MAEQLKNTLSFDLAPGAVAVLTHGLQTSLGTPLAPDIIFVPSAELEIASDDVAVTVRNFGGSQLTGALLVESWHTIERAFGGEQNTNLPVKPYIVVSAEEPLEPPFLITSTIIYARTTGSDVTGDGTLAKPYRTMQRAVRDVPPITPPGAVFYVDITGIDETLPDTYTLPAWKAAGEINNPTIAAYQQFFLVNAVVNIVAVPELVPLTPASDAVINMADVASVVNDPITQLITITLNVARPSWVAGPTIVGSFLIDAPPDAGGDPFFNAVIDSVDVTGKIITISNIFPPVFPLQIMRPSAHLHGPGFSYGALNVFNADSIMFAGIKIDSDVGGFGLFSDGLGSTIAELCVLDTPHIGSTNENVVYFQTNRVLFSLVTGSPELVGNLLIAQSFFNKTNESFQPIFQQPVFPRVTSTVFRGCDPVRATSYGPIGGNYRETSLPDFYMRNVLVADGTTDGIVFNGAHGTFQEIDVSGCAGNGITANKGVGVLELEDVGSTTPNGGFGVSISDAIQVAANAGTTGSATPLTGTSGDITVGSVGPVTWAAVAAPPNNVADFTGVSATGARISQQ